MDSTSDARRSRSEPAGESGGDGPRPRSAEPGSGAPVAAPERSHVRILCWSPAGLRESSDPGALRSMLSDPRARLWVDLLEPSSDAIRSVSSALGLHPLIAGNIEERNQRAKVEVYDDDVIHVVLFDLEYRGEVRPAELDLVLGTRFLLSIHGPDCDLDARVPMRNGAAAVLEKGTDFLLYTITDRVVDGYFPVLDQLAEEIDDLQDRVVASADEWELQRLFTLKRELLSIRRATSPAREVFNQLTNRELPVIAPEHVVYFRDVYDHLIRVTDELDNYRELVAGTLDIYLSTVNNNLSRIMKRLTGVTVILAGIGAVAGVFGMSEAGALIGSGEPTGFWLTTAVIVLAATLAAVFLRRIDWI